ncbi:MAG TPA: hypothetical protein VMG08_03750 [Allosphingosinicella sp.]|nr:hypothetical protein [Allosphingosinicella sp.]
MNRTHVVIAAMGAAIAILAIVLAFVLGRQSAAPSAPPAPVNQAATAPPAPAAPANRNATAPAPPGDADDALSRWLAGGWAEESTQCLTDTGDYYDPSGRFGRSGAEGIWRFENGQLVVTITHEAVGDPLAHEFIGLPNPEVTRSRVTRDGPDRMTQVIDGRPVRMRRCPMAHHDFAT